jgi:hypothetical protein
MPSIFKDERRGTGGFSSGPFGVRPKSALTALPPLESAGTSFANAPCEAEFRTRTVIHGEFVHAA